MVYQNNNNRIVPKETKDTTIKPQAEPVDKLLRYQPELSEINKSKANADALVKLGQGLMDFDIKLQQNTTENIIEARWRTEQEGGNKKEWRDVSKRLPALAKFNPYNKDAFNKLQAQDIVRAGMLKVASRPELEKLDPDRYNKFISETNQEMYRALKETGLNPKDYGDAIVDWDKDYKKIENTYVNQHADYEFKQLGIKETADTTFQIEAALMGAEDGEEAATLRQVLEDKIAHLGNETGIVAADSQAQIVLGGIKNYIARNADQLDDAEVLAAVSDLKLSDGKTLNEVIPNYDVMVKDLLAQAREAQLRQMKLEVEVKDFQQEQSIKEAMSDFIPRYAKGELKSPNDMLAYAQEMMDKYNLDGVHSMKLFQEIATGRKTWTDLAQVETDPRVAAKLGMKIIDGTASYGEITSAINNGTLNYKDGFTMLQNLQVREQKQQTAESKKVAEHIKAAKKEMLEGYHTGDTDIDAAILDPDGQAYFQNEMIRLENKYQQDHDYKAFNDGLAKLKSGCKQFANEQTHSKGVATGFAAGVGSLRATPPISQSQWNQSNKDINQSLEALKQMGLLRNGGGWKDTKIGIASAPNRARKITVTNNGKTYTKTARHTGYDISGATMGRFVYSPMKGTIVGVQTEAQSNGMGNMVLIHCTNGKYIKYMHLQHADFTSYLGKEVNPNVPIGRVGNTGAVGNKSVGSLHVEFYDENKQWITAKQFRDK